MTDLGNIIERIQILKNRIETHESEINRLSDAWDAPYIGDYNNKVAVPEPLVQKIKAMIREHCEQVISECMQELSTIIKL